MSDGHAGPPEIFRTREFVGWDVVDSAGEKAGSVADLLIDSSGRVRYVDVEFGFPRKHVLIPQHRLEWGDHRLVIDSWAARGGLSTLPPYDPSQSLDRGMVAELTRAYPAVYDDEAHDWRAPSGDARIVPLSQAKEFRLEKGSPDLRGWNVFGSDGERVGVISQLLVDPTALKVRYADVDLHDDLYRLRDDRHVLVPMEMIDLRERGNDAWVKGLSAADLAALPAYGGGPVHPAMELWIQQAFTGGGRPRLGASDDLDRLEAGESRRLGRGPAERPLEDLPEGMQEGRAAARHHDERTERLVAEEGSEVRGPAGPPRPDPDREHLPHRHPADRSEREPPGPRGYDADGPPDEARMRRHDPDRPHRYERDMPDGPEERRPGRPRS